jgi:hypothetical protein
LKELPASVVVDEPAENSRERCLLIRLDDVTGAEFGERVLDSKVA